MTLEFLYDEQTDVLTVEGVRYAGDVFRALGGNSALAMQIGWPFRVIRRDDGVITIERIPYSEICGWQP